MQSAEVRRILLCMPLLLRDDKSLNFHPGRVLEPHPTVGASGNGSWTGAGTGCSSLGGGLTTSATTGLALCPESCGDSAGDGGLLEDCLVSLFVRLCCKSALICFIARVCFCSDDALVQLYPQKGV